MQIDLAFEAKIGTAAFRELGLLAESYGFRAIWAQNYARGPDPFMSLVPLALDTSDIRVGVAVVCAHEMHPLKIANAVLTLNEYSRGRAGVVVTAGGEWPGVLNTPSKLVDHTREALELIRASMGRSVVNYAGRYFHARAFSTAWTTQTPPQIYAGAHGPKMSAMAVGLTDGLMFSDIQPEMFATVDAAFGAVRDIRAEKPGYGLSNFVAWHVKADREASLAEARRELIIRGWLHPRWIGPYLNEEDSAWVRAHPKPFLDAYRQRSATIEGVPERITEALVEGLTCSGDQSDLDRHIERLQRFKAAGFSELVLGLQDDPADAIRMIGERVLPALR